MRSFLAKSCRYSRIIEGTLGCFEENAILSHVPEDIEVNLFCFFGGLLFDAQIIFINRRTYALPLDSHSIKFQPDNCDCLGKKRALKTRALGI